MPSAPRRESATRRNRVFSKQPTPRSYLGGAAGLEPVPGRVSGGTEALVSPLPFPSIEPSGQQLAANLLLRGSQLRPGVEYVF